MGLQVRTIDNADDVVEAAPQQYPWGITVLLFLAPGALTTAFTLLTASFFQQHGLPASLGLDVSPVVVLEIGYLYFLGIRRNGRLSLAGVVGYRRRMPALRLAVVVAVLFLVGAGIYLALAPVSDYIHTTLFAWMPTALSGGTENSGRSAGVLLIVLGTNFLLNGFVTPMVEELYFREHLLPRMPVAGWMAIVVNAALFSIQHFWQPELYLLVFLLQVINITALTRLRDLRLPILLHSLLNIAGAVLTLGATLGR